MCIADAILDILLDLPPTVHAPFPPINRSPLGGAFYDMPSYISGLLLLIFSGLPSEAADSNVIRWQANVPAGTYAWLVLAFSESTYFLSSHTTNAKVTFFYLDNAGSRS